MRILHAISGIDPRNGGPSSALVGLAAAQQRAGLDVHVISTWREKDAFRSAEALENLGVAVRMVGPARGKLSRHPALENELIAEASSSADVVHVHAIWEEMQHRACQVAQRLRKPYVLTPHGMLTPWSLSQKRLRKRLYLALRMRADLEQASALHFTTAHERDATAAAGAAPADRPAIVEALGVDLSEFADLPPRGTFRNKFPQVGARPIILFLGRLHPGKGMEYLVPALAQANLPDAVLVAVGPDSGGFQQTLEALARRHGVTDRVVFTGMLRGRDRIEALADADLYAQPSEHENFGVSIVEALAAGVPVVISDEVGIHREVTEGKVGAVVPVDVPAVARELHRWMTDRPLRDDAAARAPAFVRERFDWDAIARRWVDHYQRVRG